MQKLLIPTLLGLAMFAGSVNAAAPLRPPQGYFAPVEAFKTGDFKNDCDAMPAPYTGSLQFRSKYEGSDKARATLNTQSEKAFRDSSEDASINSGWARSLRPVYKPRPSMKIHGIKPMMPM